MSKLSDALSAISIHNNHNLVSRFGGPHDVWVEYIPGQIARADHSAVISPRFKTDPDGPWYSHGSKQFVGMRAESLPMALAWASETYNIANWAVSPFGGRVPAHVLKAAKAAVKAAA